MSLKRIGSTVAIGLVTASLGLSLGVANAPAADNGQKPAAAAAEQKTPATAGAEQKAPAANKEKKAAAEHPARHAAIMHHRHRLVGLYGYAGPPVVRPGYTRNHDAWGNW